MTDQVKPNFLIIGAPKAGTTSLYRWLSASPDVFMTANKEPNLFLDHDRHSCKDWGAYCRLFASGATAPCRGEASAGYLAAPESPERIRGALPDVKMIVLLREPARRAFSCWCWMAMEGFEPLASFADALDAEAGRMADPAFKTAAPAYFIDYFYRSGGLYADQLTRYFNVFSREQIKIFLFDDLIRSPERVYAEACAFLEIRPGHISAYRAENVSTIPWSIKAQSRLRGLQAHALRHVRRPLAHNLAKLSGKLMQRNLALGRRPVLDANTHADLRAFYREPNARLSDLLRRDLSVWA